MRIRRRHYPHPVLTHFGNAVAGEFQFSKLEVQPGNDPASFNLKVRLDLKNPTLQSLIKEGRAEYAIHVECPNTRYRQVFQLQNEEEDISILGGDLDGNTICCPFVLASQDLPAYTNPDSHSDYKAVPFSVEIGDPLAVGQEKKFLAEKTTDSLKKLSSIFQIIPSDKKDAPALNIDISGDKIVGIMPRESYELFQFLRKESALRQVPYSMVIVPLLVRVIEPLLDSNAAPAFRETHQELRWYESIRRRLKALKVGDIEKSEEFGDESIALVQKILPSPLTRNLEQLHKYEQSQPGDEEDDA